MPRVLPFFLTLLVSLVTGTFPALAKTLLPDPISGWQPSAGSYARPAASDFPKQSLITAHCSPITVSNLTCEGYRYRDLTTGTFLTPDPLGFIDGPNRYNYVAHNPWSSWDPLGLATVTTSGDARHFGYDPPISTTDPTGGLGPPMSTSIVPQTGPDIVSSVTGTSTSTPSGGTTPFDRALDQGQTGQPTLPFGVPAATLTPIRSAEEMAAEISRPIPDLTPGSEQNGQTPAANMPEHNTVSDYEGKFPSPLAIMWYVPSDWSDASRAYIPPKEIRSWIQDAAAYHGVPHLLLAVILQQENGPNATTFQKVGQFGERTLTTASAIVDDVVDIVPDKVSGGSSGIANMSRETLKDSVRYNEKNYGRPPMPNSVRYRIFGWDQDTRISGDDLKSDLYYASGHLRQLIDRVTGVKGFSGNLTRDQIQKIFQSYNGSGPLAEKYGRDAMQLLDEANQGGKTLYFYQKKK